MYLFREVGKGRAWLTADDPDEAADVAVGRLNLDPATRYRFGGTPRWAWLLTPGDAEWAETFGAQPVDVVVFRMLVTARQVQAGEPVTAPRVMVCGPPSPPPPAARGGRSVPKYNPVLRRHAWQRVKVHEQECVRCGLFTVNTEGLYGRWFKTWTLPGGVPGEGSTRDGSVLPPCPGGRLD